MVIPFRGKAGERTRGEGEDRRIEGEKEEQERRGEGGFARPKGCENAGGFHGSEFASLGHRSGGHRIGRVQARWVDNRREYSRRGNAWPASE